MNSECVHTPFGFCKECVKTFCEAERKAGREEGARDKLFEWLPELRKARQAALEEAAKICDDECFCPRKPCNGPDDHDDECNACDCADRIRQLKGER